jgi:radical SAM protein with 4Fe4S-binding SPASM domain
MPELISIYFNITNRCNLKCIHCGLSSGIASERELTFQEIKNVIDDACKLGLRYVTLIGGEPFSRKDLIKIVQEFVNHDVRVAISTNGTLLTPTIVAELRNLPREKIFIGISLDGATSYTHDTFRGMNGAFNLTLRGIRLVSENKIPLLIQTVLTKNNIFEINEIMSIAFRCGAWYRIIPSILATGRGKAVASDLNLPIESLLKFCALLFKKKKALPSDQHLVIAIPPALTPPDLIEYESLSCDWGRSFCGILPNGDVSLCHASDFCSGSPVEIPSFIAENVRQQKLGQIFNESEFFKKLRQINADDLKGVCSRCCVRKDCRGYCRVRAFVEYGDILAPEPLCQKAYERGLFPKYALE